jgi:hypothetical protein
VLNLLALLAWLSVLETAGAMGAGGRASLFGSIVVRTPPPVFCERVRMWLIWKRLMEDFSEKRKEKKSERARGLLLVLSAGRALEGLAARG